MIAANVVRGMMPVCMRLPGNAVAAARRWCLPSNAWASALNSSLLLSVTGHPAAHGQRLPGEVQRAESP